MSYQNKSLFDLRGLYVRAMQSYHTAGNSPLSDAQFDDLKREIRRQSPQDPVLKLVGAPAPAKSHLKKAKHAIHMGSVCNSDRHGTDYDEGVRNWFAKMNRTAIATLKVDGLSVAVRYEKGQFVRAITRGNGIEGEDISANVLRMGDVPFITSQYFTGWVRGELVIYRTEWESLKKTTIDFTTARNAAAGISRRKDGEHAERCRLVAHDLVPDHERIVTFMKRMDTLNWLGFKTPNAQYITDAITLQRHLDAIIAHRDDCVYEIDGVVFTVDDTATLDSLGIDGEACYRGQVAWKFAAMTAQTELIDVKLTVGHTGAINPTAALAPCTIGGVCVTSASLCNFDEIKRLGVAIGDTVTVSRQGDVIPKVLGISVKKWVGNDRRAFEILLPAKCPVCEGSVGYRKNVGGDEGVILYCQNDECDAKATGKLKRWIKSLDMRGIGDEVLNALTS